MKKKELTPEEIERRMAIIDAREPVEPTPDELAAIAAYKADDHSGDISLEEFRAQLEGYSGRLVIRLPRSLHKRLKEAAGVEGVSLNQYILYKLAR